MVRQFRHQLYIRLLSIGIIVLLALPLLAFAQSNVQSGLEYDKAGKPVAIIVSGKNSEDNDVYLGVSIYPSGIADPLTQGIHSNETLPAGQVFYKRFPLNNTVAGTFEVAVWGKKIPKNMAIDPNNFFAKKWGFVLDQQKCYLSGWIMPFVGK